MGGNGFGGHARLVNVWIGDRTGGGQSSALTKVTKKGAVQVVEKYVGRLEIEVEKSRDVDAGERCLEDMGELHQMKK